MLCSDVLHLLKQGCYALIWNEMEHLDFHVVVGGQSSINTTNELTTQALMIVSGGQLLQSLGIEKVSPHDAVLALTLHIFVYIEMIKIFVSILFL